MTSTLEKNYPLRNILDFDYVHILNAHTVYISLLKQLVTSSNTSDLAVLVSSPPTTTSSSQQEKQTSKASANSSSSQKLKRELSEIFAPSIVFSTQQVPKGTMKKVAMMKYLHPNGVKTISGEAVSANLKTSNMPFVTDLISKAASSVSASSNSPIVTSSATSAAATADVANNNNNDSKDAIEKKQIESEDAEEAAFLAQLKELDYLSLDIMRFMLLIVNDLYDKGIFDKSSGELTPLAKRDMKKALQAAAASSSSSSSSSSSKKDETSAAGSSGTSSSSSSSATSAASSSSASGSSSSTVQLATGATKVQRNLRALLEEEASTAWPHCPVDKAVVFSIVNDPDRPRHRPLFKCTIEFTQLKKMKVEGTWQPTKRDAENAASDTALPIFRAQLAKTQKKK